MVKITEMKDDIVKVLFYLNLILLLISFFISNKGYLIGVIITNIIFNGTYIIILKWGYVFDMQNKLFNGLNGLVNGAYSMGRK